MKIEAKCIKCNKYYEVNQLFPSYLCKDCFNGEEPQKEQTKHRLWDFRSDDNYKK